MYEYQVYRLKGKPIPYVRMTRKGKFVKKRAKDYLACKDDLAWQFKKRMTEKGYKRYGREPLCVSIEFCYADGPDHRRDLDNEIKAVVDSANGIVWEDDRWIDHIDAERKGPEVEGEDLVFLTVWRRADDR